MVLDWLKRRFASSDDVDRDLWNVMERMDPLLSYDRFRKLRLTDRQRPLVRGLIDGTTKPVDIDGVRQWCRKHDEIEHGIDAVVFALRHVLEAGQTTYLFEEGSPVPAARFPDYRDDDTLTVLFNDREGHLQIASLREFVDSSGIGDYSLERLDDGRLKETIIGRAGGGSESAESSGDGGSAARSGRPPSITIERHVDAEDRVEQPVTATDIAEALIAEGYDVDATRVRLVSPLTSLGLYNIPVRLDDDAESPVHVWVVPAVNP